VGCDSTIFYNLYIFWNGDHCDSLLQFPNLVTPNGDGNNDRFVIVGLVENQCYPYNSLIIYDRTGRVVFRAYNISRDDQFWDPSVRHIPSGTYFYRFEGRGISHATQHQGCIELLK
jgi:gliding motility-associated-like protein